MNNDIEYPNNPRNGKALIGIILLVVGAILLIRQFDYFFIPGWLFSWPMWVIGWGLFIGAKSNFRKPASFILIFLGIVFLLDHTIPGINRLLWPLAIIGFGIWLILRRHNKGEYWEKKLGDKWDWRHHKGPVPNEPFVDYTSTAVPPVEPGTYGPGGEEFLDSVSIFGNVKKTILSKDFKGGDIVNIFGGAELDFTMADINGRVVIDITQIFGGTKIIVPSHWRVISDMAAIFAGLDDKRIKNTASPNSDKILVLKGVSLFAGIDIRSY